MHWFVLVALFSTPDNLAPHVEYSFEPRTYQTLAECEVSRSRMSNFIADKITNRRIKSSVFCVRVSVEGYIEGVDNLRRITGDMS